MSNTLLFFALFFLVSAVHAQSVVSSGAVTLENCGSVRFTDTRNGIDYGTVKIGGQCWMAEDLRFGRCEDSIFTAYRDKNISDKIYPGYFGVCRVGKQIGGGYLYNWQGAMNSPLAEHGGKTAVGNVVGNNTQKWQGICPAGWVLPSGGNKSDLYVMYDTLQPVRVYDAGQGFRGLFNGFANKDSIEFLGISGYYWSSTYRDSETAYSLYYHRDNVNAQSVSEKHYGFAVRCLRDFAAITVTVDAGRIEYVSTAICPSNRNLEIRSLSSATVTGSSAPIDYSWYVNDVLIPGANTESLQYAWVLGESYVFSRRASCSGITSAVDLTPIVIPDKFEITTYRDNNTAYCPEPTECKIVLDWNFANINGCGGNMRYTCSVDGVALPGEYNGARFEYRFPWTNGRHEVSCTTAFVGDTIFAIAPVVDTYEVEIPDSNSFRIDGSIYVRYCPLPDGSACTWDVDGYATINSCNDYLRYEWYKDGVLIGENGVSFGSGTGAWGESIGLFTRRTYFDGGTSDLGIPLREDDVFVNIPAFPSSIDPGSIYNITVVEGTGGKIPMNSASVLNCTPNGIIYTWEGMPGGVIPPDLPVGTYPVMRTATWNGLSATTGCTVTVTPRPIPED